MRAAGIPLHVPAIELIPSLAMDWRASRTLTLEQLLGLGWCVGPPHDANS
jgi:hypothetical protein